MSSRSSPLATQINFDKMKNTARKKRVTFLALCLPVDSTLYFKKKKRIASRDGPPTDDDWRDERERLPRMAGATIPLTVGQQAHNFDQRKEGSKEGGKEKKEKEDASCSPSRNDTIPAMWTNLFLASPLPCAYSLRAWVPAWIYKTKQ